MPPTAEPTQPEHTFVCPRCHSTTTLTHIRCPTCGVNLVMAVARAAREMAASKLDVGLPYEADKHLPRFGEFLVQNGDITDLQLQSALERQQATPGQHRTIGQILLEMGMVNRDQLDRASLTQLKQFQKTVQENQKRLAQQSKRIQYLEKALDDILDSEQSALNFVNGIAGRLRPVLALLRGLEMSGSETVRRALGDLEKIIDELQQFTSSER